ncbi:MAG TPA: DUF2868 domain-containing protein [Steroidobacteraceae bacterium]|nr:DUF2868 domain-containing protein [Steroidobacteraceae bacterium]
MNAHALRTLLLVKTIEEQDADGAMLTLAERDAATREALRRHPAPATAGSSAEQEARVWRVLSARAEELQARLIVRHPIIAHTGTLERHARRASLAVLAFGFLTGLLLSVLDSRVRIEIVAFPLLGLVLWNLAVYLAIAVTALRRRRPLSREAGEGWGEGLKAPPSLGWVTWPARWGWRRAAALVKQASFYHRPLAAALRRFADEWWPLVQPLVLEHGKRVFHLAAAAVGLGLVAGFYVRGIALEYRAGWESTFLDAGQVRSLLHVIYGAAAAVSGIVLPTTDAQVEALHWRGGAGGGPAATWIHLVAVTALLFVVAPRLLLATWATFRLRRLAGTMPVPDALLPYARVVLGGSSATLPALGVRVTPYAYEPGAVASDGLRRLLAEAYGPATRVQWCAAVRYGDETAFETGPVDGDAVDVDVLLFNLAATPELENHGAALRAAQAREAKAAGIVRRVAVVDETPFLARMGNDPALDARVEERRQAWREFVRRHGWEAYLVDLEAVARGDALAPEAIAELRRAGRSLAA